MSVIGPRPGLWNQDILTAERDKYNANDVKPGLTGWAQINGRDELEIPDKAKLDGEYVSKMGLVLFFLFISKTGILNKLLGTGIVGLIIWSSVTTAERTLVINFILCAFIYVYGKAFLEKKNKNVIKRLIKYTAIILLMHISQIRKEMNPPQI